MTENICDFEMLNFISNNAKLTILNDAKFAAICSFDKNTNIEIADNIIQSFADASLTKIEDRMAILTKTLARIPSSKTNSLGRANFLATSFGK